MNARSADRIAQTDQQLQFICTAADFSVSLSLLFSVSARFSLFSSSGTFFLSISFLFFGVNPAHSNFKRTGGNYHD